MLKPIRTWLNQWDVDDVRTALLITRLVPASCPFAREFKLFGWTIAHLPPFCKLNPLYDELMSLRFRALSCLEA